MSDLASRLDAALNRRGYTKRSGASKVLSWKIGRGDATLWRYRTGSQAMAAETLIRLIDHFRESGDTAFAAEVLGETVSRETIRYWATDKGVLHRVNDLAVFAAQSRGLDGVAGDHSAAVRRNLGWVSVVLAGGVATVEYHERGISARSVNAAADVIRHTAAVCRTITMQEGRRITLGAELARDAIHALEGAVTFKALPPPLPWRVERLNVGSGYHPSAEKLAHLAATASDLVTSAANAGLLQDCNMFRVDGEEVICLQMGVSNPLPQAIKNSWVGRNIWQWRDLRYATLLYHQLMEARREGPTYYRLEGTIEGQRRRYRRPIFPCKNGIMLTYTDARVAA